MNNDDWERVEKDLSTPLEIVKLEIDGYNVTVGCVKIKLVEDF